MRQIMSGAETLASAAAAVTCGVRPGNRKSRDTSGHETILQWRHAEEVR